MGVFCFLVFRYCDPYWSIWSTKRTRTRPGLNTSATLTKGGARYSDPLQRVVSWPYTNSKSTWKWMVGILVSLWDDLFSGAFAASFREGNPLHIQSTSEVFVAHLALKGNFILPFSTLNNPMKGVWTGQKKELRRCIYVYVSIYIYTYIYSSLILLGQSYHNSYHFCPHEVANPTLLGFSSVNRSVATPKRGPFQGGRRSEWNCHGYRRVLHSSCPFFGELWKIWSFLRFPCCSMTVHWEFRSSQPVELTRIAILYLSHDVDPLL